MMKKMVVSLLFAGVCSCVNMSVSYADYIDTYRNMLKEGKFFLKFTEITPQARQTNKDKCMVMGRNTMMTEAAPFLENQSNKGIVTQDGDAKYEEIGSKYATMCRLTKGEEVFNFTKHTINDKTTYYGDRKGQVKASKVNYLAMLEQGYPFGNQAMTDAINAFIPNSLKGAYNLNFRKVSCGSLNNGLYHEDYRSDYEGGMYVVRYYFRGGSLVKIATAQYGTNKKGKFDGQRHIFLIEKFTNVPDKAYLVLPNGLVDKTKREKKAAKEE